MPFTLSHAAAALPIRRTHLVPSALVVGCLAPDFEYFLGRHGAYGHKLPGMFTFDLPLAFVTLWLFHHYAREPLADCLPEGARRRFDSDTHSLSIRSFSRLALIVVSILVGIATHIIWDSFTHSGHWPTNHFHWFRHIVELPVFGERPVYAILQYLSSVFGIVAILIWYMLWYRKTSPLHPPHERRSVVLSRIVVSAAFVIAVAVALVRAVSGGVPEGVHGSQRFMTEAALTGLPTFWIEVLIYGFILRLNKGQSRSV